MSTEEPSNRLRSAVILVQGGKVALIRRDRAGQTYYVFPGGGVEFQETLEQTAIREAQEELGVHVEVESLAAIVRFRDSQLSGKSQYYFHAHIVGGEFGSGDGEELSAEVSSESGSYHPVWLSLEELHRHDVRPFALRDALLKGTLAKGVVLEIDE